MWSSQANDCPSTLFTEEGFLKPRWSLPRWLVLLASCSGDPTVAFWAGVIYRWATITTWRVLVLGTLSQDLTLAKQVLYSLSHLLSPCPYFFWDTHVWFVLHSASHIPLILQGSDKSRDLINGDPPNSSIHFPQKI